MFIEDDGWEEEEQVVPVDEDDAISNIDSEHADEQSSLVTSSMRQMYPLLSFEMDLQFKCRYSSCNFDVILEPCMLVQDGLNSNEILVSLCQ